MTAEQQKNYLHNAHLTRRYTLGLLGSLLLLATGCQKSKGDIPIPTAAVRPTAPTPRPSPTDLPKPSPTAIISEEEFQRLNQERTRLIARQAQKPADATSFPSAANEAIKIDGTNIQVSVNGIPTGLEIFYSPSGIKQLYRDLNLSHTPTLQLHLLTGGLLETIADTRWLEGYCRFRAPIQYMDALVRYVLPHFPQNDWDGKATDITQEWNNRINAIARHESKHAASHFQINNCKLVSQTPKLQAEIEAMQEEIQGRGRPLVFWLNLKQGELFSKYPLVQTFWRDRE